MFDGTRVASAEDWRERRRPEIKALFEKYVYGRYPQGSDFKPLASVQSKVLFEDPQAFGGAGTLKEVELTLGPPEWPKIYLLIATPNGRTPAACFVGMNFGGNHLLVDDERVHVPESWMPDRYTGVVDNRATDASRGVEAYTWPMAEIVARGYAVATFHCGDIQPDRPFVREGMRATLAEGAGDKDPAETATIMWWAWGIHRAIDYLVTDKAIDPQRIAVVGHSRLGKTALLAGAFDERIALTVANQAGCGGSGPSRHDDRKAETVKIITDKFPHWFGANFTKFGDDPSRLPVDQNCLVALCAPRAVLFTAAADDRWANPSGQFEVLQAASPAYELLGVVGLKADAMPAADAPLLGEGRLGYWFRAGEHSMTPADWKVYMDFADQRLQ
jgi:dienelactone hydrolase